MILHMHRAGHGTYNRNRTASRSASSPNRCGFAGVDHLHSGTAVGKLEGDPLTVQGYYNVCRELRNGIDCRAASISTRTGPIR